MTEVMRPSLAVRCIRSAQARHDASTQTEAADVGASASAPHDGQGACSNPPCTPSAATSAAQDPLQLTPPEHELRSHPIASPFPGTMCKGTPEVGLSPGTATTPFSPPTAAARLGAAARWMDDQLHHADARVRSGEKLAPCWLAQPSTDVQPHIDVTGGDDTTPLHDVTRP